MFFYIFIYFIYLNNTHRQQQRPDTDKWQLIYLLRIRVNSVWLQPAFHDGDKDMRAVLIWYTAER